MGLLDWFGDKPKPTVPEELWARTLAALPFLAALAVDEKKALKTLVEGFLAEKEFSVAGGLELSDEICVSIAAQGCLPILKLGLAPYRNWVGIVVYPDEFVVSRRIEDESGIVHEFDDVLSGEAWEGGPLIISWHDAQMAGAGYNVVIHEFAHKLDMLNGDADGMPALHSGMAENDWQAVFSTAYDDFCRRVDSGEDTLKEHAVRVVQAIAGDLGEATRDRPTVGAAEPRAGGDVDVRVDPQVEHGGGRDALAGEPRELPQEAPGRALRLVEQIEVVRREDRVGRVEARGLAGGDVRRQARAELGELRAIGLGDRAPPGPLVRERPDVVGAIARVGVAVGAAALAVLGVVSGYREFVVLAIAAAVAILIAFLLPRVRSQLTFRRENLPRFVQRGESLRVALAVETAASGWTPDNKSLSGADVVLADTAGRLHTKTNLMDELRKVRRVASKGAGRVTEVLLVIDATTGQNGLTQARQFGDALVTDDTGVGLTGVVLTKLDGSAKGGVICAIAKERPIALRFIGVGEGLNDLRPFDAGEFVDAMFD